MENRLITYYGLQGVPEVTNFPLTYTPSIHRAHLQAKEGAKTEEIKKRIIKERRKKGNFNRQRDALQRTKSVVRLNF